MSEKLKADVFSFPPGTEMFHFPGFASSDVTRKMSRIELRDGLPHSEIPGSKVAKHLPEAYRSHAASFIASLCQGIHHRLLITCPDTLNTKFKRKNFR